MKYKKKDYKTWNKSQKQKFLKVAQEHQELDRFIQWKWLQDEKIKWKFKGCFYWCMTQTDDNTLKKATEVMWLPAWIVYVSEKIFEWLPRKEALKFPLELLEKIPTWIDTYPLWKDWNYTILMDKKHGQYIYCWDNEECKEAVKKCAELFKTDFTESAARSAAWSAESARSTAWSAAESARSAAIEHYYIWLRDTLYTLLER